MKKYLLPQMLLLLPQKYPAGYVPAMEAEWSCRKRTCPVLRLDGSTVQPMSYCVHIA